MSRLGLAVFAFCIGCGTPATPRAEAKLAARADAGAGVAVHPRGKGPWTLVPARAMCWARGPLLYCVELLDDKDAAVVTKPTLYANPPAFGYWHLEGNGSVTVSPPAAPGENDDPKEVAASKRQFEARKAIARKLPPLARFETNWQFGCGLLPNGDVSCWSEPKQMVNEPPVIAPPVLVPNAHDVTDFFLEGWSTLCVLTKDGAVLCSPKLPIDVSVCVLRPDGVRCGEQVNTQTGAGMTVSAINFDPRKQLSRPLVAIPDLTGARAMASYANDAWYDNLSDKIVVVDVKPEGGCAVDGQRVVRCWERDVCPKGKDWRTQKVEGLADIVAVALAIDEGYALDAHGQVFGWSRPARECNSPAPIAKPLFKGAKQIHAGMFGVAAEPYSRSLACAAMLDETVRCWRKLDEKPVVVQP